MHILIEDKTVSENLRSILALLRKEEAKREKVGGSLMEKKQPLFVHRKTGRLIFADMFKEQDTFQKSEWKPLLFTYAYDPLEETFHAAVFEEVGQAFRLSDLTPKALAILIKTLQVLNRLATLVKGPGSDLVTKLQDLCTLQIEEGDIQKARSLLTSAWHAVDRKGAERLLKGHPIGTFLFREDYFAQLLADQLTQERGKHVKCITLSVLDSVDHLSDFTLVHIDHQWRVYDNIQFCDGEGSASLEELLQTTFKGRLKEPLYHVYRERRIA